MEVALELEIEKFAHECVFMHQVLRDPRPLTDMEYRLLKTHLQRLAAELALKKSLQRYAPKGTIRASR